jgi:SAM-dependent methyltransferase
VIRRDLHQANRLSWNAATKAHNSHKRDQAGFLREGGSTLAPEEVLLLGDVQGADLVHLLCNAGQDTLSIASGMGARVTGVDVSDEAIEFATKLATDSGIAGKFIRADVYDWFEQADAASFDVAFSSYGAMIWLSDLGAWARGLARVLRPGGRFVLVEFHPLLNMFDEGGKFLKYPWGGGAHVATEGVNDYVAISGPGMTPSGWEEGEKAFVNPHPDHTFSWGLGDVIGALLGVGFTLERFVEWDYARGWKGFPGMREEADGKVRQPAGLPAMPMMYGLVARRIEPR